MVGPVDTSNHKFSFFHGAEFQLPKGQIGVGVYARSIMLENQFEILQGDVQFSKHYPLKKHTLSVGLMISAGAIKSPIFNTDNVYQPQSQEPIEGRGYFDIGAGGAFTGKNGGIGISMINFIDENKDAQVREPARQIIVHGNYIHFGDTYKHGGSTVVSIGREREIQEHFSLFRFYNNYTLGYERFQMHLGSLLQRLVKPTEKGANYLHDLSVGLGILTHWFSLNYTAGFPFEKHLERKTTHNLSMKWRIGKEKELEKALFYTL